MRQTIALFVDAYRELNAKKLFWITMVLSAVVAACFFFVGINASGMKVGVWQLDDPLMNTQYISKDAFYKMVFSSLAVRYYFGIAAAVLAVISTAGIFPDMLKEGSIDLMLSKPIGRLRLFLTRYATGLLFAFLQVLVFTTICFFVIGIRGGVWEPGLFLAVPFFVLFFSYLFAVSVLVGTLTRSTIAALLITLLFFSMLIGINATDVIGRAYQLDYEMNARVYEDRLEIYDSLNEEERAELDAELQTQTGSTIQDMRQMAQGYRRSANSAAGFTRVMYLIKWPLPKTGDTLALLEKTLINAADLPTPKENQTNPVFERDSEIARETIEELERPVWWIVGTSLAFELILLSCAGWVFCRRDY